MSTETVAPKSETAELQLDVDQAGELKEAMRRRGMTLEDLKVLCERPEMMEMVIKVLRWQAVVQPIDLKVDTDIEPVVPSNNLGLTIAHHVKTGVVEVVRRRDGLYLNGLRVERKYYPSQLKFRINTVLVDFLLANQQLIPSYMNLCMLPGTIFRGAVDRFYVRRLIHVEVTNEWTSEFAGITKDDLCHWGIIFEG